MRGCTAERIVFGATFKEPAWTPLPSTTLPKRSRPEPARRREAAATVAGQHERSVMDAAHIARLTRFLSAGSSRRFVLHGLAVVVGISTARFPAVATARKQRKSLVHNAFGCVDVGGKCRGKDSVCCSGICQGKKFRKGRRDTSRCVAHDTGGCRPNQVSLPCGGDLASCVSSAGEDGACYATTGNAGYCAASGDCFPCTRDADCRPYCGAGAACIPCPGSMCADVESDTVCASVTLDGCVFL